MAAGVMFDAPGPKTVARHRVYTAIVVVVLLALAAYATYLVNAAQFLLKLRAARLEGQHWNRAPEGLGLPS